MCGTLSGSFHSNAAIVLIGLVGQRFREQSLDAVYGLALARLGAKKHINIKTHGVASLRIACEFFEEGYPASANHRVDAFPFLGLGARQEVQVRLRARDWAESLS
jgi:hypothetical protein